MNSEWAKLTNHARTARNVIYMWMVWVHKASTLQVQAVTTKCNRMGPLDIDFCFTQFSLKKISWGPCLTGLGFPREGLPNAFQVSDAAKLHRKSTWYDRCVNVCMASSDTLVLLWWLAWAKLGSQGKLCHQSLMSQYHSLLYLLVGPYTNPLCDPLWLRS